MLIFFTVQCWLRCNILFSIYPILFERVQLKKMQIDNRYAHRYIYSNNFPNQHRFKQKTNSCLDEYMKDNSKG